MVVHPMFDKKLKVGEERPTYSHFAIIFSKLENKLHEQLKGISERSIKRLNEFSDELANLENIDQDVENCINEEKDKSQGEKGQLFAKLEG